LISLANLFESSEIQPEILASIQDIKNMLKSILNQQGILSETYLLEKINIYKDVRSERMLKYESQIISSYRAEDKAFWGNKKAK
jgi:hypothetical protein